MIHAIVIFNNSGKPRFTKFFYHCPVEEQQKLVKDTFHLVARHHPSQCNVLEGVCIPGIDEDVRLVYKHYVTLYFAFYVDSNEGDLVVLDLIQVFVECLDKFFGTVCELDLIFHVDKVHYILQEMVMGGLVVETSMNTIISHMNKQEKVMRSERDLIHPHNMKETLRQVKKNTSPQAVLPRLNYFNLVA